MSLPRACQVWRLPLARGASAVLLWAPWIWAPDAPAQPAGRTLRPGPPAAAPTDTGGWSAAQHYETARRLLAQGKGKAAIPHLEAVVRADPGHSAAGHDLATAYLQTGVPAQALAHLRAALAGGESATLLNLVGAAHAALGDPAEAAKALYRAAELDASEPHLFDLAEHLLRHRSYEESRKFFRFGAGRFPRSARLAVGLGISEYSLGSYEEALKWICAAVDLDPSDRRALSFLGQMHDVSPAMAEEVTRRLAAFANRYPNSAQANYYYALSLWRRHEGGGAVAMAEPEALLKRALALDRRLAGAHFQLGILYEDTGRDRGAIGAYRRALQLDPDSGKAHYRLAQLYLRSGRKDLARRHLAAHARLKLDVGRTGATESPPVP